MNATMSLENTKHYPVMLSQILSIISPQHGGTFIDCTFGGGGYSKAILKHPNTKVIAIDRDKSVKKKATALVKEFPNRFSFYHEKFSNLNKIVYPKLEVKAIIFDLGLSTYQIADHERGFSFKSKGNLSMQMGLNKISAYEIVNFLDKTNLSNVIKILGEEKEGKKIANKIAQYRIKKKIETPEELTNIIKEAKRNNFKKNPATKTFQALRIIVNKELTELIEGLIAATELLKADGILILVSFHSLEDRIIKNFFKLHSSSNSNPSRYIPQSSNSNNQNLFKFFQKKVLTPSEDEIKENHSSRSAKLRYGIRNNIKFSYSKTMDTKFNKYTNIEKLAL